MSFRIQYAGNIRKSETKTYGDKTFVEVQLCAKNYAKPGDEPTFTWLRVSVLNPKDFQIPQLQVGCFIAGSGEFTLRSYVNKDGAKAQSAECRSSSFDIDGPRQDAATVPAPSPKPRIPSGGGSSDDNSPPFHRYIGADVWA